MTTPAKPSLRHLRYHQRARVVKVHGEGETAVRLQSLGLLPGREIHRENTAPLGDPVAYRVDGQKISVRLADADAVEIEII